MAELHEVYQALGEPTRLAMLDRLIQRGELTTAEVTDGFGMSRQAATKHLLILEEAGLVRSEVVGRRVVRRIEPATLMAARAGLEERTQMWAQKLRALAMFVEKDSL